MTSTVRSPERTGSAHLPAVGVSSVVDALDEIGLDGVLEAGCQALLPKPMIGPAVTIRLISAEKGDAEPATDHWKAFDDAPEGSVVVISTGGMPITNIGGVTAAVARARGVAGAYTDGAIRDLDEIREYGFQIYFRSVNPRSCRGFYRIAPLGSPLTFGNVIVSPGDIIVADADGVVAIPSDHAGPVLARALEIEQRQRVVADYARAYRSILRGFDEVTGQLVRRP